MLVGHMAFVVSVRRLSFPLGFEFLSTDFRLKVIHKPEYFAAEAFTKLGNLKSTVTSNFSCEIKCYYKIYASVLDGSNLWTGYVNELII